MEDLNDDDIQNYLAKISHECQQSAFEQVTSNPNVDANTLPELLGQALLEKEDSLHTLLELANLLVSRQQKLHSDSDDIKNLCEQELFVKNQEIQQINQHIIQIQSSYQEQMDKNQELLDIIEKIEHELSEKRTEVYSLREQVGKSNQDQSQEHSHLNEQLHDQAIMIKSLEDLNKKQKSEILNYENQIRSLNSQVADYQHQLDIQNLQVKNTIRDKEKATKQIEDLQKAIAQLHADALSQTSKQQQQSQRRTSIQQNNEMLTKIRRQSGILSVPKIEQINGQLKHAEESIDYTSQIKQLEEINSKLKQEVADQDLLIKQSKAQVSELQHSLDKQNLQMKINLKQKDKFLKDIEALKTQVSQNETYKQQCESLESQIKELNEQLTKKTQLIDDQSNQLNELNKLESELQLQIIDLKEQIKNEMTNSKEISNMRDSLDSQIKDLQQQALKDVSSLKIHLSEIQQLKTDLKLTQSMFSDKDAEIEQLKQHSIFLENEKKYLEDAIAELKITIDQRNAEIQTRILDNEGTQQKLLTEQADLKQQIQKLKASEIKFMSQNEQLEQEMGQTQNQLKLKTEEIISLQQTQEEQLKVINEYSKTIDKQGKSIEELTKIQSLLQLEVTELKSSLDDENQKNKDLSKSKAKLQEELLNYEHRFQTQYDQIHQLEVDLELIQKTVSSKNTDIEKQQQHSIFLENEKKTLEDAIAELKITLDQRNVEIQGRILDNEGTQQKLLTDQADLKQQIQNLKASEIKFMSQNEQLEKELGQTQNQLKLKTEEIISLSQTQEEQLKVINEYSSTIDKQRKSIEELTKIQSLLQLEVTELKSSLDDENQKNKDLSKSKAELQEELLNYEHGFQTQYNQIRQLEVDLELTQKTVLSKNTDIEKQQQHSIFLENEKNNLEDAIAELKITLDYRNAEIQTRILDNEDAQQKLLTEQADLQQQIQKLKASELKFMSQNEQLEKGLGEAKNQLTLKTEEIISLQQSQQEQLKVIDEYSLTIDKQGKSIEEFTKIQSSCQLQIIVLTGQIENEKQMNKQLSTTIESLDIQVRDSQKQALENFKIQQNQQNNIKQLEEDLKLLKQIISNKDFEMEKQKQLFLFLEIEKKHLENSILSLQMTIDQRNSEIKQLNEQLKGTMSKTMADFDMMMQNKMQEQSQQMFDMKTRELEARMTDQQQMIIGLKEELLISKNECKSLNQLVNERHQQNLASFNRIQANEEAYQKLLSEKADLQYQIEKLKIQELKLNSQNEQSEKELKEATSQLKQGVEEIKYLQQQVENSNREIATLKEDLIESDNKNAILEQRLDDSKQFSRQSSLSSLQTVQSLSTNASAQKKQIYEQFFQLTSQAVVLNSTNPCAPEVKLKSFYNEVLQQNVPFHKWNEWLVKKLADELAKKKTR